MAVSDLMLRRLFATGGGPVAVNLPVMLLIAWRANPLAFDQSVQCCQCRPTSEVTPTNSGTNSGGQLPIRGGATWRTETNHSVPSLAMAINQNSSYSTEATQCLCPFEDKDVWSPTWRLLGSKLGHLT